MQILHPTKDRPFRLGIVGNGVVGGALAKSYTEWCEVFVFDKDPAKAIHQPEYLELVDLVFVCLPSPQEPDGSGCDLSIINGWLEANSDRRPSLCLRSTVPVGTTAHIQEVKNFDICHSPEFLTARCAALDAQMPSRNVLGGRKDSGSYQLTKHLYVQRFGPNVPLIECSSCESEFTKLAVNAFFATKLGFMNDLYELCDTLGLTWSKLLQGMLTDGRIHPSHTNVPGPDGRFGFGGACLPKDLVSLRQSFTDNGLDSELIDAVAKKNNERRFSK